MKKMQNLFVRLYRDEEGGELLEYALIAGLIVIAAVAAIKVVSGALSSRFDMMTKAE